MLHKYQKYTLSNHNHQTDELALLSQDSPQATVSQLQGLQKFDRQLRHANFDHETVQYRKKYLSGKRYHVNPEQDAVVAGTVRRNSRSYSKEAAISQLHVALGTQVPVKWGSQRAAFLFFFRAQHQRYMVVSSWVQILDHTPAFNEIVGWHLCESAPIQLISTFSENTLLNTNMTNKLSYLPHHNKDVLDCLTDLKQHKLQLGFIQFIRNRLC